MDTPSSTRPETATEQCHGSLREILSDAIRYWETRRIAYNVILAALVVGQFASVWPRSKVVLHLEPLLALFVLAVLANVCYSAAYFADIPMQYSAYRARWLDWRGGLWCFGTLFAAAITFYWLVDEILPTFPA
jgi:hypothetical protein